MVAQAGGSSVSPCKTALWPPRSVNALCLAGRRCSAVRLSVLHSFPVPCATIMSQSPTGSCVDDETFLLEYRCHPVRPEPPSPSSPPGKRSSAAAPGAAPLPAMGSPPSAEPRRIVLSTDSPAALKMGTQQLIPRSLAVSTKTKNNPSQHQSFGATGSSREPQGPDPKRASVPIVPSISVEADEEDGGGGALKRNLRSMSYRAAMKGLGTEPDSAVPSLKPVPEEGSALPAHSPTRNKVGFASSVTPLGSSPTFLVMSCCWGGLWSFFSCNSCGLQSCVSPARSWQGLLGPAM